VSLPPEADGSAVDPTAPHAHRFALLGPEAAARWSTFLRWPDATYFPNVVGLEVDDIRLDYCRLRLPYRPELDQPAGVVHGGAIATLIDTVVVPAVGAAYDTRPIMLTITMNVQYLGAVRQQDAIAEGWVEQRGRSTVFCRAEVRGADGRLAATGTLVYAVRFPDGGR